MVDYFFDSSALVKKYLYEEGTENVIEMFAQSNYLFISHLTELELTAAIEQAKRIKRVNSPEYRLAIQEWDRDLHKINLTKVRIDNDVIHLSKRYIRQHRLRAPDAIQLASAFLTAKRFKDAVSFVCSDQTLLDAARLERLPVAALK